MFIVVDKKIFLNFLCLFIFFFLCADDLIDVPFDLFSEFFLSYKLNLLFISNFFLPFCWHQVQWFLQNFIEKVLTWLVYSLQIHCFGEFKFGFAVSFDFLLFLFASHFLDGWNVVLQLFVFPKYLCDLGALDLSVFWMFVLNNFLFSHFLKELTNFLKRRLFNLEFDTFRSGQNHKIHEESAAINWQLLFYFCQLNCIQETFLKVLIHEFRVQSAFLLSFFLLLIFIRFFLFCSLFFWFLNFFFVRICFLFSLFFLSLFFSAFFIVCFFVVLLVLFVLGFFFLFHNIFV